MRIAVTYEDGKVFQHFGHCESFKIYQVADNKVVESSIITPNAGGHDALAGFLLENKVDVLICGGIGGGAIDALANAGIIVCSGAEGDADEVVMSYIDGSLSDAGQTCNHHEEEGGCGGGCGSGCGGCGGGCHSTPVITLEGPNAGKTIRAHYRGTFDDGTQFDSSYDRGEPLEFVCGAGMMIKGFDVAVLDMAVGEKKTVHIMPEDAYGETDPRAIKTFKIAELPGSEDLTVGQQVYMTNMYGQPFPVKVIAKDDTEITLDANHEMAGKELNFDIEIVEIK